MLKHMQKETGTALVVITHDERIAAMAQRRFDMADGVISQVCTDRAENPTMERGTLLPVPKAEEENREVPG